MEKVRIAIDAMGGDNAPVEVIKGAINSLENPDLTIILVGQEEIIKANLRNYDYNKDRVEIVDAREIIENEESPTVAIKNKKDSSMVVGLNLVKDNKADAFVSAGSTGALLTGATMIIGRIKGIKRPALATLLPNIKNHTLLIDAGSNVDCKPEYLVQFATMGSLYMEKVMKVTNPKVGLANIGTEDGKGNELSKESFYLLKDSNINFNGNIEARQIPYGDVDVVVCDGFVGNIILKLSEGLLKSTLMLIKEELMSTLVTKIGALLSKKAFANIKKRFDYREIGGAPFLGLKSLVIKAHGSSDALAFKGAINQCYKFAKADLVNTIDKAVNEKE